jgi:hypothetical protein
MASDDQTPTAQYLSEMSRHLDVVLDVDLGELIEGHRVVARGIEFGVAGDELHYEFVPHGTRDIGGFIPRNAASLVLRFESPGDWTPPEPWTRELTVDLRRNH